MLQLEGDKKVKGGKGLKNSIQTINRTSCIISSNKSLK